MFKIKHLSIFISCFLLLVSTNLFATHTTINSEQNYSNITFQNHSETGSGGVFYITSSGKLNLGSDTNFITNTVTKKGGAIYNDGLLSVDLTMFSQNISSGTSSVNLNRESYYRYGGAIYNNSTDTITINSSIFELNKVINNVTNSGTSISPFYMYGYSCGGAIYNSSGTIIINSTDFDSNSADSKASSFNYSRNGYLYCYGYSYGGAIYNSSGTIIINSTDFSGNNATGNSLYDDGTKNAPGSSYAYGYGGAIYNGGITSINLTNFENNIAKGESRFTSYGIGNSYGYGYGGAIYNDGIIYISSTIFRNNIATGKSYIHSHGHASTHGYGGAIYNNETIFISSTSFVGNKATATNGYGGAIYNNGTMNIQDGVKFENNVANLSGGAIYNRGLLNLIANTDNIEFTGNKANEVSNAIHSVGTINLRADYTASIIFNDRITGYGTINAVGKVILNEDMSGYTGTVNLYDGEIKLQAKVEEGSNINTNKLFSGNLNLEEGTLNIRNNAIDDITLKNWTSTENNDLKFDTDLSNNRSDNFTITNNASGKLRLMAINILGVNGTSGQITLFNNEKSPELNILTTANYGGYEYTFTNSDILGVLNYEQTGTSKTFKQIINATTPAIRSYSLANNELVTEDLGNLGGTQLTIFGNGYDIDGNTKEGITLGENQTLNIEDVKEIKNFNSNNDDGVILNNGGIVNIGNNISISSNTALCGVICNYNGKVSIGKRVNFEHNISERGVIANWDNETVIDSNAIFNSNISNGYGGAIYNYNATLTVKDGAKFINNTATDEGGAIRNIYKTLNLIANTNDIEFTGNKAKGISNAIDDREGTINLWASENASIIFNDRITSYDTSSILNINQSSGTLPTTGKVILNEDMSGYKGQVNLYDGEIELKTKPNSNNINTNKFFSGNINLQRGTLNILNNSIDNITINSLTTTSNTNLKFDTDLSNNTNDNFTITNTVSGELNLTAINILGTNEKNGQITLFNNEKSPELNILTTANYGGYEYTFTNSDILGVLNYEQTGTSKTFKEVVNDIVPQYRSYSLANNELVTEDLGQLGGTQLTIFGNGYDIDGNTKEGITLGENQILNIDKGVGELFIWKNFNKVGRGGAIYNSSGTVTISSTTFESNSANNERSGTGDSYGGAIYNNGGTITISSTTFESNSANSFWSGFKYGGAIYNNSGTIIIDSTIFKLNSTGVSNIGYDDGSGSGGTLGYGGAIYNSSGTVTISSTTFESNSAIGSNTDSGSGTGCGGAIYNRGTGTITISSTTFESNSAKGSNTGSGTGCGGAIYNYGIINISSTTFESNSAIGSNTDSGSGSSYDSIYGGAIYNRGTITISSTTFESNSVIGSNTGSGSIYCYGGAIYNYGIINISSTTFESNSASCSKSNPQSGSSSVSSYGGAIYKAGGETLISSTIFKSNSASGSNTGSGAGGGYGGAIYNSGTGTITISSTTFESNNAKGSKTGSNSGPGHAFGGAIYNNTEGKALINSTIFEANSASGSNSGSGDGSGSGGAIYNNIGTITISSAIFKSNSASGSNTGSGSGFGYGGAIYNRAGTITISSTTFESNSASFFSSTYSGGGYGGAIYTTQNSKTTFMNGIRFINNKAKTHGGAIYNDRGILNLIANTNDVEFTGNTANGISNAIHDNGGTINLWASQNADIIFNDRITSEDNTSILNINSSTTTLNAVGKVILNEDMSGYTGTVNLYDGEIKLQAKVEEGSNINTNKFFSGNINLSSGKINILNNAIDNITVNNLTTTSNTNLKFDTDLSSNTSDNFTVTSSAIGTLNLTAINILEAERETGTITLFNNEISPELNVLTTGVYNGYEYSFSTTTQKGVLDYKLTGTSKTFKEVVNDIRPGYRSYSLANNELVTEDLGNLGGTQLTIFGNGYDINGNEKIGITLGENQTLNIEDVKEIKNFNSENHGGFVYNDGGMVNITNNTKFSLNSVNTTDYYNSSYGGALYNYEGEMNIGDNIVFSSNSSVTSFDDSDVYGGALGNENYSKLIIGENAKFEYNYVEGTYANGGAIYNGGHSTMTILSNALFDSNYTISNNVSYGGAIYNKGYLTINDGVKFINNKVLENEGNGKGGAIYNIRLINLIANTNDVEFTGNTANGISNAIHDNGGTINLWASQNADIIFNDRITSEDNTSILNINSSTTTLNAVGKVILNEDMSGYTGIVNLYNGTVKLGEKGTIFGGNMFVDKATIDMANEIIQGHNFNTLTINNTLNLIVDADLENKEMDTIYANSFNGKGKINVKAVNILSDAKENKTKILFTSSTVLKDKITSITTASSKLYKYDVVYNNGYFYFKNTNIPEINPIIAESAIASSVGGFATQVTVLGQVFTSMNNIVSSQQSRYKFSNQTSFKSSNLYASTSNHIFDMENKIERGLWIRPYAISETIKFNEIDVDNTAIGTLAGLDLATGENSLVSFYLGYAGSNQKYEDIKVSQTGYIIGATGMIIKEKWYAGLTANINFNKAESQSDYGTDEFDMNMYSVGAKAGYNLELNEKWTLEPNLMLMYGTVSNQEYETTQGAKVDSQSNSNIIVEPQVKAKLSLDNGWQPYGLLGYVANMSDKAKVVVDGAEFETDKINGYVEYGAGVNKEFINTPWSCYLEATGRSGGRTGFAGNLGIKYKF